MKLKQILELVSSEEDIWLTFEDDNDKLVDEEVNKSAIIRYYSHLLNYEVVEIGADYNWADGIPVLSIRLK